MIWNKLQVIDYLNKEQWEFEYYLEELPLNKEWKSRQQEKTYYLILNWIAKHLWYSIEEVKIYMLSWTFWTKKLKLSKTEIEIPVISRTRDFTKEQAIFFIDVLLNFCKLKNIPIKITPRELQSLYESYN